MYFSSLQILQPWLLKPRFDCTCILIETPLPVWERKCLLIDIRSWFYFRCILANYISLSSQFQRVLAMLKQPFLTRLNFFLFCYLCLNTFSVVSDYLFLLFKSICLSSTKTMTTLPRTDHMWVNEEQEFFTNWDLWRLI